MLREGLYRLHLAPVEDAQHGPTMSQLSGRVQHHKEHEQLCDTLHCVIPFKYARVMSISGIEELRETWPVNAMCVLDQKTKKHGRHDLTGSMGEF